jgi:hypothetical protein
MFPGNAFPECIRVTRRETGVFYRSGFFGFIIQDISEHTHDPTRAGKAGNCAFGKKKGPDGIRSRQDLHIASPSGAAGLPVVFPEII